MTVAPRPSGTLVAAWVLVGILATTPALAAPPARRLLQGQHAFASAARTIDADIRVQTGPQAGHVPLTGLRSALRRSVQLTRGEPVDTEVILHPDLPPGAPAHLLIARDKTLVVDGALTARMNLARPDSETPPALRVLALALGARHLERAIRRAGVDFEDEVLTLDRIDGRLVWAVGNGEACVWLDRALHRLVRLELGPGVIDDGIWAATLSYDPGGPGRGWFPTRVTIEKNREHIMTVHTASVTLGGR